MSNNQTKQEIMKEFQLHEGDQGSSEVQIALLTSRINELVDHLKAHKKDHSSRRGLLILVGRRRKLMQYLQRRNPKSLANIAKKLKLKVKNS